MRKTLTSQAGFSLIELMIVVAIIGILAAIAVPNYQGFQRKARQAEAKTMLGAVYTGEKAYFAEYQGYTNHMPKIGVAPDGTMNYLFGFNGDGAAEAKTGNEPITNNAASAVAISTSLCVAALAPDCTPGANLPAALTNVATYVIAAGPDSFLVGAEGLLGGASSDIWEMNQGKALSNVQSGL